MRADIFLVKYFDIQSRNKASELIKSKKVLINDKLITKPSYIIHDKDNIKIIKDDYQTAMRIIIKAIK